MKTILCGFVMAAAALGQVVPPNNMGVTMGHLHLFVPDVAASKKIWVETFGAKEAKSGTMDVLMFPGVTIMLNAARTPREGSEGSIVDHLGFLVQDLDATKAKLTAAGIPIVRELPATRQAFGMFPGGIKVEFSENKTIAQPMIHHHIHIATKNIAEQRAWYAKHFGAVPGTRAQFQAADIPGVNLTWMDPPDGNEPKPISGRSVDHIGFEVTNLEAFVKKLEADGVKIRNGYRAVPQINLAIAFVEDPWGVTVELTEGLNKLK